MTDVNLNPQISVRLRAVQQAWGHESPGESLAVILDSMIHGWSLGFPETSNLDSGTAIKVRLKARHVKYFTQISQFSGFSIADSVKSYLIKWLCSPPQIKAQSSLQPIQCASPANKFPKPRNKVVKSTPKQPQSQSLVDVQLPLQAPSKPNGRALLGGLLK